MAFIEVLSLQDEIIYYTAFQLLLLSFKLQETTFFLFWMMHSRDSFSSNFCRNLISWRYHRYSSLGHWSKKKERKKVRISWYNCTPKVSRQLEQKKYLICSRWTTIFITYMNSQQWSGESTTFWTDLVFLLF